MILWLCDRAYKAGALQGDMCIVQHLALDIAVLVEDRQKDMMMRDMQEFWLCFTNNEAFKQLKQQQRAKKEQERMVEMTPDQIQATLAQFRK